MTWPKINYNIEFFVTSTCGISLISSVFVCPYVEQLKFGCASTYSVHTPLFCLTILRHYHKFIIHSKNIPFDFVRNLCKLRDLLWKICNLSCTEFSVMNLYELCLVGNCSSFSIATAAVTASITLMTMIILITYDIIIIYIYIYGASFNHSPDVSGC